MSIVIAQILPGAPLAIRHKETGKAIYSSYTAKTFEEAVAEAVRQRVNLGYADLSGLDLRRTDFRGAMLEHACFSGCILNGSDFSHSRLRKADFRRLTDAGLKGVLLQPKTIAARCDFSAADLSGANLAWLKAPGCDFIESRMVGVYAHYSIFSGSNFAGALASGADFYFAAIARTHWRKAILSDASLEYGVACGSLFVGADLVRANLTATDFAGADFKRANLADALTSRTIFTGARMPEGKSASLSTAHHQSSNGSRPK
jgi:uncharacterized protein YjbI with pentapeptide repeats